MTLGSHHLLTWLLIGLISGALAGRLVRRRGMGCLVNIVVGLAGAFIGGLVLEKLGPPLLTGTVFDDVIVAFLGAVILLALLQLVDRAFHRSR